MTHKGTVPLATERLLLRRFTVDDAQEMFDHWASDPQVTKFLMWQPHENVEATRKILAAWEESYAKPDHYHWALQLKGGALIGSMAAVQVHEETQSVHIGYCIGAPWWRQGYTSEALCEVVRFFFGQVGVNRVESRHDPRNPNSGKVMLHAGLRYEGTLRQADHNNQGLCDAAYYGILADEYREGRRGC